MFRKKHLFTERGYYTILEIKCTCIILIYIVFWDYIHLYLICIGKWILSFVFDTINLLQDTKLRINHPIFLVWKPGIYSRLGSSAKTTVYQKTDALAPLPCIDESLDLLYFFGTQYGRESSVVIGQLTGCPYDVYPKTYAPAPLPCIVEWVNFLYFLGHVMDWRVRSWLISPQRFWIILLMSVYKSAQKIT